VNFTGYRHDEETGFEYALARYYDSARGRFTSFDPIQERDDRLRAPQPLNFYEYVTGNPLKYVDLTGRDKWLWNAEDGTLEFVQDDERRDGWNDVIPGKEYAIKHATGRYSKFEGWWVVIRPHTRGPRAFIRIRRMTKEELAPEVKLEVTWDANTPVPPPPAEPAPLNPLKNPFSTERWILNGLSNSLSDLVGGDKIAEWSWVSADHRRPSGDRWKAGAKLVGFSALQVGGGVVTKGVGKFGGKLLGFGDEAARLTTLSGNRASSITSTEVAQGALEQATREAGEEAFNRLVGEAGDSAAVATRQGSANPLLGGKQVAERIRVVKEALSDETGRFLGKAERLGVKHTIRRVEKLGYELEGSIKYRGNQGIDLVFRRGDTGRLALAEAKYSGGLGSLAKDTLGIRQGSFRFFETRLERAGRFDLLDKLRSGSVDLYGGFYRSGKLYRFDAAVFYSNVNFRLTQGAAILLE
jgi:RHS repeat-associated protein